MTFRRSVATAGLLAFAVCAAPAGAAERVVFHGGHSILVRQVEAKGDLLVLELLEGGTITLPKSAVESRERVDAASAMEEWKKEHRSTTVASRDSDLQDAASLSWEEKMKVLESGPPPMDTGTEPSASLIRTRGYSKPLTNGLSTQAPYGLTAPTDVQVRRPAEKRVISQDLISHVPPHSHGGVAGSKGGLDPRVRAFIRNGNEPPSGGDRPADIRAQGGGRN